MRVAKRLLLLCAALVCACGVEDPLPDIVLVSIDTLRADRLGCYGYPDAQTPSVDSLATHGTLFEAATAVSPLTLPAHTSMLTGVYPHVHGARNNGMLPVDDVEFVAEALQGAGYRTAATVSAAVLNARFGLDYGFGLYDDDLPEGSVERDAASTTTRALEQWKSMKSGPRMLWVHYFDPHHPYRPAADSAAGDARGDAYDAEIARVDRALGRLLAGIRASSPNAIVLLLADHGEAFGEHGELQHGMLLYQTTIHVPMILSDPRDAGRMGVRISSPVSTIDVEATLRELAGLPQHPASAARSLRSPATNRAVVSETLVPFYNHSASPLASIRIGNRKYILAPRPELYDPQNDPAEEHNLWTREDAEELSQRLAELHPLEWLSGNQDAGAAQLDPQSRSMLQSLGYIGGGGENLVALTDPKDVVIALRSIRGADVARSHGDLTQAERSLRDALELLPDDWSATWKLGDLLAEQGRLEEAEQLYLESSHRNPRNLAVWLRLARIYRIQGRYDESLAAIERVRRVYPDHPQANIEHALTIAASGEKDAAITQLRRLSERTGDPAISNAIEELSGGAEP